jgi:hypothetical protein
VALSRIALGCVAAAAFAAQAAAQTVPAEDAAAAQRDEVRAAIFGCGETDPEEIVVCGRREREEAESQRYRVPPSAAYSGPRDTSGGAQREAMEANTDLCSPVGTMQRCSGGVDVLSVLFGAVRIVQAIRARRD